MPVIFFRENKYPNVRQCCVNVVVGNCAGRRLTDLRQSPNAGRMEQLENRMLRRLSCFSKQRLSVIVLRSNFSSTVKGSQSEIRNYRNYKWPTQLNCILGPAEESMSTLPISNPRTLSRRCVGIATFEDNRWEGQGRVPPMTARAFKSLLKSSSWF